MNSQSERLDRTLSLAVVHDQFVIRGGGERLVMELTQALRADLVIGGQHPDSFSLNSLPGRVLNLQANTSLPGLKTRQLARAFQTRTQSLRAYDSVLYSGVAAPLAVTNHRKGRNVFYCHTPPRFLYDKQQHYMNQLNPMAALALRGLNRWFRPHYEQAIDCMDLIVANSAHIQQRIRTHLGRDSVVVHPPCHTDAFASERSTGDFYLSTARLDPLKRVDVIIRAFRRMPKKKLVVASGGSEEQKLKKLAAGANNIHFTGWLNESQYQRLLAEALASIYIPKDEDFGMSPVESMAAGTPVFCSNHGGLLETVVDGQTGFYIDENRLEDDLAEKIQCQRPSQLQAMKSACQSRAFQFDSRNFLHRMAELLA